MSIITNTTELQVLTGSFFASSTFNKIKTDIELETESIILLIGQEVYDKALAAYVKPGSDESKEQSELVQHVQLPIALMATFRYYQANMVTHGDNGRKVTINGTHEKMAWEWMIDKDDQAQLRKAYTAVDRLINYLEKENIAEWISSEARKTARELFVNSTAVFQRVFPIDSSPRFFYTVLPFIRTIQLTQIKPALGDTYEALLTEWQANDVKDENKSILELVQQAIPLLTMAMATRRLSVQVMPDSVVQNFRSETQSLKGSSTAMEDAIRHFRSDLLEEGFEALDKARQLRTGDDTDLVLLPKNSPCNKFMRT